jgi:membrane-bound ClpP family serine protease
MKTSIAIMAEPSFHARAYHDQPLWRWYTFHSHFWYIIAFTSTLDDIPDTPETVAVVEMDTFGGRIDSALEMVDALVNAQNARTVAFVTSKAISAGALISPACNQLVMKRNTTIGDCAPIIYTQEGPQMLGEKSQSPLRAKFRTLAKKIEKMEDRRIKLYGRFSLFTTS